MTLLRSHHCLSVVAAVQAVHSWLKQGKKKKVWVLLMVALLHR
jgi:hypothetical protein